MFALGQDIVIYTKMMNHTTVILKDWLAFFSNLVNYTKMNRNYIGPKVTLNFISYVGNVVM